MNNETIATLTNTELAYIQGFKDGYITMAQDAVEFAFENDTPEAEG